MSFVIGLYIGSLFALAIFACFYGGGGGDGA